MNVFIRRLLFFCHGKYLMVLSLFSILMLEGCSDYSEIGTINSSQNNMIRLSIPDAERVQVRSVAIQQECMISNIQVFVYNETLTSIPVYYLEGKKENLSFLSGNRTASPTVTLKNYMPQDGDRIYVVCNLTERTTISDERDFLLNGTIGENQLRSYSSQGMMKGFSGLPNEEWPIPMYGYLKWDEAAASNICLLTRCLAKVMVDADLETLFPDKEVYWEWKNLNYSDFMLDSSYQGDIYKGTINENGVSEKHDLLSAAIPVDATKGLVAAYYPLEYKHSTYALGNEVDKNVFSKDRAMLLLTVQNQDGTGKEYYRLDFWDKNTGAYWDILRNHSYLFNITKLKSKGYTTEQEAILNPGSNIEYSVTVFDNWSQGFASNGQYLIKTDREEIKLLGGTSDPVIMTKIELQADDAGNVNFDNVTTRRVRILGKDKKLLHRYLIQTFYSTDNKHLYPIDNGIPGSDEQTTLPGFSIPPAMGNECELPMSDKYWIYCTVMSAAIDLKWLTEGYLEITMGNIVKLVPFSVIPHSDANPIDEEGPANSFITPVTYGVYSFDATVMGNGVDGIVSETREYRWGYITDDQGRLDLGQIIGDDMALYHFKDALGNDISTSKNATIAPQSAKLVWQDKENLISQVALNSNTKRVQFLSKGTGNGVIAVYDKSDPNAADANILWSWHIWCTDKPNIVELGLPTNGETYSGKNYKIMDRDLGATTTTPDELTTCGLGYQWGRKDPFIGAASLGSIENASTYNVRGYKLDFKEIIKTENIGTIEYAIKHPEELIVSTENSDVSDNDWLYYESYFPAGNHFLWGNPFSRGKMQKIGTIMKTIYDPCPAGYKVPPQDIYGAFLKKPVIKYGGMYNSHISADIKNEDFYPFLTTKYGIYFHYGKNGEHSVYFIAGSTRYGRSEYDYRLLTDYYTGHTSGDDAFGLGDGSNGIQTFSFSIDTSHLVNYNFGGGIGQDRVIAGQIRCIRNE